MLKKLVLGFIVFAAFQVQSSEVEREFAIPVDEHTLRSATSADLMGQVFKGVFGAAPTTSSYNFAWLEADSSDRIEFLKSTRLQAEQSLFNSVHRPKIRTALTPSTADQSLEETTVKISSDRRLAVINKNFSRTVYDIVTDPSILGSDGKFQETKKLITAESEFLPAKAYVLGVFPSPDKKLAGILFSLDGSIDNIIAKIYDLEAGQIIDSFDYLDFDFKMRWYSNTEVIYIHPGSNAKGFTSMIHDVRSGKKKYFLNCITTNLEPNWVGAKDYETGDIFLKNNSTGDLLKYTKFIDLKLGSENSSQFFLISDRTRGLSGAILTLDKKSGAEPLVLIKPLADTYTNKVTVLKKASQEVLAVHYIKDATHTMVVYNLDGTIERSVELPIELSLSKMDYDPATKSYVLNVVSSNKPTTIKWAEGDSAPNFEESLKPDPKMEFEIVSKIEYFKSADGALIPARLNFKKGLVINGKTPVFMDVYGGFFAMGYLGPVTKKVRQEFIRRGGIHVGLGVRGGAERGLEWYLAANGKNKIKTSQDVIAVAQGLVERGYTVAQKIAISGTSNGGYVVASSAMLSPDSFGLVIPISGVHDQLDFSSLDRWGFGWEKDYLDPYDYTNFSSIVNRSPLELTTSMKNGPEFLIVNGENDTRVNKAHSYKLKAHLDVVAPGKAILFSVQHAGHWPDNSYLIDDIGIDVAAIIWAKIFDHMEMNF